MFPFFAFTFLRPIYLFMPPPVIMYFAPQIHLHQHVHNHVHYNTPGTQVMPLLEQPKANKRFGFVAN